MSACLSFTRLVVLVKSPSPVLLLCFLGLEKVLGKKTRSKINIVKSENMAILSMTYFPLISDRLIQKTV